jgi:hypothetical protein
MNTFHTIPSATKDNKQLVDARQIISENIILTISFVVHTFQQPKVNICSYFEKFIDDRSCLMLDLRSIYIRSYPLLGFFTYINLSTT